MTICVCERPTCRWRCDRCACGAIKKRDAQRCRPCFDEERRAARPARTAGAGRTVAVRTYSLAGKVCEWPGCEDPAVDRHHRDGDTLNNARGNVGFLCRLHHSVEHGRNGESGIGAKDNCAVCGRLYGPLRLGRCSRCASHRYRWGREYPQKGERDEYRVRLGEPVDLTARRVAAGTIVMPGRVEQQHNRTVRGWVDGDRFCWIGGGRTLRWIAA